MCSNTASNLKTVIKASAIPFKKFNWESIATVKSASVFFGLIMDRLWRFENRFCFVSQHHLKNTSSIWFTSIENLYYKIAVSIQYCTKAKNKCMFSWTSSIACFSLFFDMIIGAFKKFAIVLIWLKKYPKHSFLIKTFAMILAWQSRKAAIFLVWCITLSSILHLSCLLPIWSKSIVFLN